MLKVNEIFYSVQGESSWAGRPCLFIRLTGCNIHCNYCDTEYARDRGEKMTVEAILERISHYDCKLVEITGGEPLIQAETPKLAQALLNAGHTVLVESNGTRDISVLPAGTRVIMDVKCPGSGASTFTDWQNMQRLTDDDEIKFVLSDHADYEWAKNVMLKYELQKRDNVLFSAVAGRGDPSEIAAWILEDQLNVRLQLQMHKILWPEDEKGR